MISIEAEVFQPAGALTIESIPGLLGAIESQLKRGVGKVDFSRVTDVDSAAVALVLEWQRQAAGNNVSLELLNLPEALSNLAKLYGVAELLQPQAV